MKFNLFNIIIVIVLIYILYRLPSVEKMSNIDVATENKIREIYKIDTDAIRNLSNLAKDLTVNGKLKVPGGLEVDGALNFLPRGSIIAWNGNTAPVGWAICDGANETPDLRGRFILGLGQGAGLTNRTLNQKDGNETHTLTVNEIPAHKHTMNTAGNHNHKYNAWDADGQNWRTRYDSQYKGSYLTREQDQSGGPENRNSLYDARTVNNGNHTHTINYTGGGQAHNNMPPFYVLAYIMRL